MAVEYKVKRALISVSSKAGIIEFSKVLTDKDVEILSTGGTASLLRKNQIAVKEVSEQTHFPEIMDGRVKTLHPKIHGAILRRPGIDDNVLEEHDIQPIDLVVVNLYPFREVISNPDTSLETAIENIDIGGPTMLRAAAKNHAAVAVIVDPEDYSVVLEELNTSDTLSKATRFRLAQKAFAHTAQYDTAIANYFKMQLSETASKFPDDLHLCYELQQTLRYGENPHQQAAFYREHNATTGTITAGKQLQGKALSYNNIADSDAALECVKQFREQHACVIVKHANPCGVAIANHQLESYQQAFATDPTSSFGGIIAFNKTLLAQTAEHIISQQFVEVIIAPRIEPEALPILQQKPNVRVLEVGDFNKGIPTTIDLKKINGGLLIQDSDNAELELKDCKVVTSREPTSAELQDCLFAWKVAKFVKSNAIVYAKNGTTIGVGAGQMSRVYSARIAEIKATDFNLVVKGSVMASDAFFPFRDSIDNAAKAGITAIIQPGGSIRDIDVINAANEAGITMIFTGIRHFRH